MNTISLITDFGSRDNFVGIMKAVMLKVNPEAKIIDISHEVTPQDILEAAFLLQTSYSYFPPKTVHLVVVDPGVGSARRNLLVRTKRYFFIAPDNGVLTFALKEEPPVEMVEITNDRYFLKPLSRTFHGRDIFAPVAARVARGERIRKFGDEVGSFIPLEMVPLSATSRVLTGRIIHIDRFGNLISNIDRRTFKGFIKNRRFKISLKDVTIDRLSSYYTEGLGRKPLVLFDSFDYLEIAVPCGSAKEYLSAKKGDEVSITACA